MDICDTDRPSDRRSDRKNRNTCQETEETTMTEINPSQGMTPMQFKKIQKLAKLTNEQVAEQLRVSLSLVEKWRMGQRVITHHMAWAIAKLLEGGK
jgi:DNA-binding transcriptional regulator YiaG